MVPHFPPFAQSLCGNSHFSQRRREVGHPSFICFGGPRAHLRQGTLDYGEIELVLTKENGHE